MSKLYLIDGMSLVFRAYHALTGANLKSPDGEPTSAVFAFTNILTSLLDKEKPEFIAVVFDTRFPTFRHEKYPLYKANRDAFPDDLVPQLARIKELITLLGIKQIEMPGFEADDLIGTLAKTASEKNIEVACVTNDKDYYQLVDDNVKVFKPGKKAGEDFDIISYEGVEEKFGVIPAKVIDVLALIGDSSDNIPGVKGIGEKTAIPLIQKFGSLEVLYENLETLDSASVKKKLEESKDMAFLSKELVTIESNIPIDLTPETCVLEMPDYSGLDKLFTSLGFTQIRKKWADRASKSLFENIEKKSSDENIEEPNNPVIEEIPINKKYSEIDDLKKEYKLIDTTQKFEDLLKLLEDSKPELISLDLETSSLDRQTCEIVGISLSFIENKAFYIAVYGLPDENGKEINVIESNESQDSLFDFKLNNAIEKNDGNEKIINSCLPSSYAISNLKPYLESQKIGKCGQNIKFDIYILKRYGIDVSPVVFDTMVASYLLNSDEQHNMDAMSRKWLNYSPIPISILIGEKKSKQLSMRDLEPSQISDYACEDADITLKLRNKLFPELVKEKLLPLAEKIEFPLIEVLLKMEFNGVAIDTNALKEISNHINEETVKITDEIYTEAGTVFNIDSPKQLGTILFEKMQIPTLKKNKTGYSTDIQVMEELSVSFPIARKILDYRQLTKLKSTYVEALPKLINPKTGRIHTTFNQTIASTGRLSSTDPNLQNIPIRTDLGKEIRKAFTPGIKDNVILSADYSQIELRIMAYYCADEHLITAFKEGIDIHSATASILFEIPLEQVNSDMRRTAKTVNFGIMYGLGAFGLSQRLGIGRTEAQQIINNYFNKYPGIKKYMEQIIHDGRKIGYVETLCGRRKYFPMLTSENRMLRAAAERAAINMPIQGTASDMLKLAMLSVDKQMKKLNLRSMMMIQVHDELVFEAFPDEIEELKSMVKEEMESALPLGIVPVVVETGVGNNWFEAH